jgi:2-hydroxychromene-2-carboxylate isomerase
VAIRQPQRLQELLSATFKALWIDALDLNRPELTARVASNAGFDVAQMQDLAGDPEIKDALKAVTQEAIDRGVFGAPTLFVGREMFFGQDRLDWVREELAR